MMVNNILSAFMNRICLNRWIRRRLKEKESKTIYIWLVVIHKILKEQESVLAWKINICCPLDKFRA